MAPPGNNCAILQINDLQFIIEQEFSDGYGNTYDMPQNLNWRTHPPVFLWKGGQFKPTEIAINLIVDKGGNVETPEQLNIVLAKIMSYSIAPKGSKLGPDPVTVSVGTWFTRTGYIENLVIVFKPPWDVDTGMPLQAEVKFTLLPDFLAFMRAEEAEVSTKLPTQESFHSDKFMTKGS